MNPLPKQLDPIKLAKQHAQLTGKMPLQDLPRLQELGDQTDQLAFVELKFDQRAPGLFVINGHIKASLNLTCQRCNGPMQYEMDTHFLLSPVTSEARAKKLPDEIEPIFIDGDWVDVRTMIEDEILLSLPMIPKHEQCD